MSCLRSMCRVTRRDRVRKKRLGKDVGFTKIDSKFFGKINYNIGLISIYIFRVKNLVLYPFRQ